MGIDPKERFTKGDEVGNVQDRVRRELMKLHAVNKKKPAEEFKGRKRESVQVESKKHHPIAAWRLRDAFSAGKDDLVPFGNEPLLLGLGEIELPKLRRHPAGRRVGDFLLPYLVLVGKAFDAYLQKLRQGATKELESAKEMQQWWQRKDNELVNSNNPTITLIKRRAEGMWAAMWCKKQKR
jgi:hypothetical protein